MQQTCCCSGDLLRHEADIDAALASLRAGAGEDALSDFHFANLFLFRRVHDYRYLGGAHPCIEGRTYDGFHHLLPLFDPAGLDPELLLDRLGGRDFYYPVPKALLSGFDTNSFVVDASDADADYLYPAANFLTYRGGSLKARRLQMQGLLRGHVVASEALGDEQVPLALGVLRGWMEDKGFETGGADELPCIEALLQAARFGLRGTLHRVDGAPAGFLLAQKLNPGVWAIRFAKALDRFAGLYPYMFARFCEEMGSELAWLNFEQDMGLANFRQAKMSYRPSRKLAKYRVAPRDRQDRAEGAGQPFTARLDARSEVELGPAHWPRKEVFLF